MRFRSLPSSAPAAALTASLAVLAAATVPFAAPAPASAQDLEAAAPDYRRASAGTRVLESDGGLSIRVLVEAATLGGGEVEVAEITFPPGPAPSRGHRHGAVEILYVLEGVLDHVVDGVAHRLTPGMVGVVRPTDTVIHHVVSEAPVRALVIWAPAGEVERLAPHFRERPAGAGTPGPGG